MKRNINSLGRIVRAVIGVVLIVLSVAGIFQDEIVDIAFLIFGAVFILASLIQFCPLNFFLGINHYKTKKVKMY